MEGNAKVAIFWDESFLWGLIAYDTFRQLGVSFDLLSSGDIRDGALEGRAVLFVPGGWASDKIVALGDTGRDAIRDYVAGGGSYLGFCGGAGLALSHESGLGLAAFGRVPTIERLPSFSGRIVLERTESNHPMWAGVGDGAAFHAWWPGQFAIEDGSGAEVLARYAQPLADSYVTDLPVGPAYDWKKWEEAYGINLDPERIIGEPAVVETRFGDGRVVLSYLHFETPGDMDGNRVLANLLDYLAGSQRSDGSGSSLAASVPGEPAAATAGDGIARVAGGEAGARAPAGQEASAGAGTSILLPPDLVGPGPRTGAHSIALELAAAMDAFIELGRRNFLWYRREPWLLQWRRGMRGIEYSTLAAMLGQIARLVPEDDGQEDALLEDLQELRARVLPFLEGARRLIILERFAMTAGPISPLKTDDDGIAELRGRLFSTSKRCGGEYEQITSQADSILLPLLRKELAPPSTS
ncbi:MAG: hypothetical protein C4534_01025 [Gaiellales bacterium]|nr:MAG: hypothetical protein C4534_01025 [Gaiellales bacterium]